MATWKAAEAGKAAVKLSTNLTRLHVAKNPHHMLGILYGKILRTLAKMPSDYPYRKYTEEVVIERSSLAKATTDIKELEAKINCGQIEEVLVQAQNEYDLARKLLETKAWEPLNSEPPPNQWKWPI